MKNKLVQIEVDVEDQDAPNIGLDDQDNEIPSELAPSEAYGAGPSTEIWMIMLLLCHLLRG